MENLLVLLIVLSAVGVAISLFVRLAGARRRPMEPLSEKPPALEAATAAPKKPPAIDTVIVVAITSAVTAITPGTRVTRIEEEL